MNSRTFLLQLIRCYQKFISPYLGRNCRFYPTCSEYCYESVVKYGIINGGLRSFSRIVKCHPWNRGGVDRP